MADIKIGSSNPGISNSIQTGEVQESSVKANVETAGDLYNHELSAETAEAYKNNALERKAQQSISGQIARSQLEDQLAARQLRSPADKKGASIANDKTQPQTSPPPKPQSRPRETAVSDMDASDKRAANYKPPVPPRLPGDGRAVSVDEALDLLERPNAVVEVGSHGVVTSDSHEWHKKVWRDSLGMKGEPPVAYVVGDKVRIDVERLTPAQKQRYLSIIQAQESAKAASAAASASSNAVPGEAKVAQKGATTAEKEIAGAGKAARAAKMAEAAEKGMSTAGKLASGAGKVAGAVGHYMPLLDALMLQFDFFTSYGVAQDRTRQRGTQEGFADGLAAALLGVNPEGLAKRSFDKSEVKQVAGTVGIEEKAYNKALVDGYKFVKSLPLAEQNRLREEAFKVLASKGYKTESPDSFNVGDARVTGDVLLPVIKQMFEEARKAAEAERMKTWNQQDKMRERGNRI